VDDLRSPRRPDLRKIRVTIRESEIQAFLEKFPRLGRDEIFEEMSRIGPDRAKVEAALEALANRPAAKLLKRIQTEAEIQESYRHDREAQRSAHPSESLIKKL
jgi:hypothetical protein